MLKSVKTLKALRRRVLFDGVIEERSAAMGRVFTVPADPRSRKIDVSDAAPGWERWQTFLRRHGG
jgi:hypothetical protein